MRRVVFVLAFALTLSLRAIAFDAGAAKVDITPPLETPLNGYYDRMGRGAVAVHDPVWARSLYINDGTTGVLLVNLDLCIVNRELRDRVLELAPAEVPKENIILTATHTHSAQGGMNRHLLARSITGRFMPDVLESTAKKIAESMQGALAARKRATIGYATATHDNLTENRQVPGGPIDQQIGVIRVDDSDGNAIAIIANIAAHPTTVGGDDRYSASADYPGVYYNAIEAQAGEACVAMFMNGAEGNQRPANPQNLVGWAHTEWVGNQLATKVMESAKTITGGEATLHIARSTPALPATLATSFMPPSTILISLEINDLLVNFVPGEPCVEIGLELRRQALQRGYSAQFTVGLANDHLLYFVPRDLYATQSYECGMTMYGPGIDQWFYREFAALMSKGEKTEKETPKSEPTRSDIPNGTSLQLTGTPYETGFQQGSALKKQIEETFQQTVVSKCEDGSWIPTTGWWPYAPAWFDQTPLALPRLGIGARPMLASLSGDTLDRLNGIADGAQMPFDALWLLQCAPTLSEQASIDAGYRAPFCTMLAVVGDRAGTDQVLVGRNLDWQSPEPSVVFEVRPKSGMRYAQVGFPWTAGTYTGMNDAGLVIAVERVESLGAPSLNGPSVDMVLHEALTHDRSVAEVLTRLELAPHLRGYHVLIVDAAPENARVVELGEARVTRVASSGILLGVDPGASPEGDAAVRYNRAAGLLRSQRVIDSDKLAAVMSDREPARLGQQQIRNAMTRHSVVFEPRYKRLHVSFPNADGAFGKPVTISLRKTTP